MKFLRKFDIDIIRLKEGEHQYRFEIDQAFLDYFKNVNEHISDTDLAAEVTLDKRINLIEAKFEIRGTVELTCDRSLELFNYPMAVIQKVIYKYGQEEKEINEEIIMITRDTPSINVAQLIYEFIMLAIPAKKIHPDYLEDIDDEEFDQEGKIVYSATKEEVNGGNEEDEHKENPLWEALKKLKNKE
ncbi:YceD family protein [Negadavirga shengliensis]|uniref:YceD family protein n=1 Tax=Negadavirga shengliensis TaxID=1389218 RepID=A0ABV9T4P0_9BACT